jgi:hypothetical protein
MRILSWWAPLLLPREWLEGGDGGVGTFCLLKPLHWLQSQALK